MFAVFIADDKGPKVETGRMHAPRILIVDDEPDIRTSLQTILAGFFPKATVHIAANGPEALDKLGDDTYDLIVSDLRMPKMDGFELLGHVKKRSPQTLTMLVTAFLDPSLEVRAKDLGVDAFYGKPVDVDDFIAGVQQVLANA